MTCGPGFVFVWLLFPFLIFRHVVLSFVCHIMFYIMHKNWGATVEVIFLQRRLTLFFGSRKVGSRQVKDRAASVLCYRPAMAWPIPGSHWTSRVSNWVDRIGIGAPFFWQISYSNFYFLRLLKTSICFPEILCFSF